jgi:hypothetical protein
MATSTTFRLAADIVLILHASFVLFVIVGLLLVFIGKFAQWGWVRNFWFRAAHLGAIGLVLIQSWFRVICVSWFWIPPRLPKKFSKRDAQ